MLDFKSMTDFELIAAEAQLEASIEVSITQMKYNSNIPAMEEELEVVKQEIKRRGLNV